MLCRPLSSALDCSRLLRWLTVLTSPSSFHYYTYVAKLKTFQATYPIKPINLLKRDCDNYDYFSPLRHILGLLAPPRRDMDMEDQLEFCSDPIETVIWGRAELSRRSIMPGLWFYPFFAALCCPVVKLCAAVPFCVPEESEKITTWAQAKVLRRASNFKLGFWHLSYFWPVACLTVPPVDRFSQEQ